MPQHDAVDRICALHELIVATPAATLTGIVVKLRLSRQFQDGATGIASELLAGALADVERLVG